MSEQNKPRSQENSRRPVMYGYAVRPIGDGSKSNWSKVAAAWAHKDGEGYEIKLDAFPVDGRLVLRSVKDDRQLDEDVVDHTQQGPA